MSSVARQEARYSMSEDEATGPIRLTDEEAQEVLDLVAELFGITGEPDPLIDLPMIAELAGVASNTPKAWQQRTRNGQERVPFPAPHDDRYTDKPQWHAVRLVEEFLKPSGRWPRGSVARESTRVTKRYTFKQLVKANAELADDIRKLKAVDDVARSIQGWRSHRTRMAGRRAEGKQHLPATA